MPTYIFKAILLALLGMAHGLQTEDTDRDDLQRLLTAESKLWSILSYSQLYPYFRSEPVLYTGTVYLKISSVALDGCDLKIEVVVQDRYVGAEDRRQPHGGAPVHKETSPLMNTYQYSYRLSLKVLDSAQIDTVLARPAQLTEKSSLTCSEEESCSLPWLRVIAPKPLIVETRVVDGFEDVHEMTHQMVLPITSGDRAAQLAKALQKAITACHVS